MQRVPPLSVFCSYSHKDEKLRDQVETGLAALKVDGWISEVWYDRKIVGGEDWENEINQHLHQSDLILLLISINFIASKYIMSKEIKVALERHQRGDAHVVPIILTPVSTIAALSRYQALPRGQMPLSKDNKKVNLTRLLEVAESVRGIIERICSNGSSPEPTAAPLVLDASQTVLAQLCDRAEQELQLREAWKQHSNLLARRPFLCLVHGSVQEHHAGYVKRLIAYSLPQAIGLGADSEIRNTVQVRWPESAGQASFSGTILSSLSRALNCQPQGAAAKLYQLGEACVVHFELFSSAPNYRDRAVLKSFFDFWSEWPDLSVRQKLIVILSIQYRPDYPAGFPRSDVDVVAEAAKGGRLSAVILNELPPVSIQHVKQWMQSQEIKRYCDIENNSALWEAEINDVFGGRDVMPMGQLTGFLNRMLNDYQRRAL